jgi:hypothetical protein
MMLKVIVLPMFFVEIVLQMVQALVFRLVHIPHMHLSHTMGLSPGLAVTFSSVILSWTYIGFSFLAKVFVGFPAKILMRLVKLAVLEVGIKVILNKVLLGKSGCLQIVIRGVWQIVGKVGKSMWKIITNFLTMILISSLIVVKNTAVLILTIGNQLFFRLLAKKLDLLPFERTRALSGKCTSWRVSNSKGLRARYSSLSQSGLPQTKGLRASYSSLSQSGLPQTGRFPDDQESNNSVLTNGNINNNNNNNNSASVNIKDNKDSKDKKVGSTQKSYMTPGQMVRFFFLKTLRRLFRQLPVVGFWTFWWMFISQDISWKPYLHTVQVWYDYRIKVCASSFRWLYASFYLHAIKFGIRIYGTKY